MIPLWLAIKHGSPILLLLDYISGLLLSLLMLFHLQCDMPDEHSCRFQFNGEGKPLPRHAGLLLSSDITLYNPAVNKRARKRLKEAIEKKNLERQKMLKEQSSASSQTKERRGFTAKPEKKRG